MIVNYIKLAWKVLQRRRFFTFISLFGISLTLVVLMVATAILDNLFAPRAPETRLERSLVIYTVGQYGEMGGQTGGPGYGFLDKYLRGLPGAERISIFTTMSEAVLYDRGRTIETFVRRTDGEYWRIFDHEFVEGVPFTHADDEQARFVAVINTDLREQLFDGRPAVGKMVEVDGQRFRVVGVVKSMPITRFAAFSGIWAPIGTMKNDSYKRGLIGPFGGVVLARSRGDFPALRQAFAERLKNYQLEDPKQYHTLRAGLDTPFEAFARAFTNNQAEEKGAAIVRTVMIVLALLFVLLPTMNLVSINLSRIMERASEIGVRKAFGASSRMLVGQFVVENVVLTVIGGMIGFLLSVAAIALLNRAGVIPYAHFDVNLRIFAYGMGLTALFGVLSGAWPAWRMSRLQAVNALRGGAA
jgi:putative ABC transport system permease protein